jgi:hypothetical protein
MILILTFAAFVELAPSGGSSELEPFGGNLFVVKGRVLQVHVHEVLAHGGIAADGGVGNLYYSCRFG